MCIRDSNGGIALGGFLRRMIIALDQSDLAKLPFSDDVNKDSRLLMRRNIRDRVSALAPFLTYDPDAYIVLSDDGRLSVSYTHLDVYKRQVQDRRGGHRTQ